MLVRVRYIFIAQGNITGLGAYEQLTEPKELN